LLTKVPVYSMTLWRSGIACIRDWQCLGRSSIHLHRRVRYSDM